MGLVVGFPGFDPGFELDELGEFGGEGDRVGAIGEEEEGGEGVGAEVPVEDGAAGLGLQKGLDLGVVEAGGGAVGEEALAEEGIFVLLGDDKGVGIVAGLDGEGNCEFVEDGFESGFESFSGGFAFVGEVAGEEGGSVAEEGLGLFGFLEGGEDAD